jgi:hypothetical protein
MKELPVNIEPLHCSKANITKEVKKITINPCTCPASNREVKVA